MSFRTGKAALAVLILLLFVQVSALASAVTVVCDSTTGWALMDQIHRGQKGTIYKLHSTAVPYTSDIQNGIGRWGSRISASTSALSTSVIYVTHAPGYTFSPTNAYGCLSPSYNTSTNHIVGWSMYLNPSTTGNGYAAIGSGARGAIVAHEMGHAFGLADLTNPLTAGLLMNPGIPSSASVPKVQDGWGMDVATHTHTNHSFASTGRCTQCGGISTNHAAP